MSSLEEQLSSILSDPGQMAQLQSLAQSLMGSSSSAEEPAQEALSGDLLQALLGGDGGGLSARLLSLLRQETGPDDKRALVQALEPYLSEKRRGKLERALRLAKMAKLARLAMGEMNNGEAL